MLVVYRAYGRVNFVFAKWPISLVVQIGKQDETFLPHDDENSQVKKREDGGDLRTVMFLFNKSLATMASTMQYVQRSLKRLHSSQDDSPLAPHKKQRKFP